MSQRIEFENPNDFAVTLVGPDGRQLTVGRRGRVVLDDWWKRYCPQHLQVMKEVKDGVQLTPKPISLPASNQVARRMMNQRPPRPATAAAVPAPTGPAVTARPKPHLIGTRPAPMNRSLATIRDKRAYTTINRRMVGRTAFVNAQSTKHFVEVMSKLDRMVPSFSDGVGVGILSYNRLDCLKRLISSIRIHTDLSRTTVFVSDESTDSAVKEWLRNQGDVVLLDNKERLGVAGNSNRLLKCLSRFKYKILLNDDVEILNDGWQRFYVDAMQKTGMHHFCFRQNGVYGATPLEAQRVKAGGLILNRIEKKVQGAVMALDHLCFEKVGYFDEGFNPYGMEHVDWSHRVQLSGIQPQGFYDVSGSEGFFRIHHVASATEDRSAMLSKAQETYRRVSQDSSRIFLKSSVTIPSMSVIIPFRGNDRGRAIKAVVENVRCQLFPNLEIVVVEQDEVSRLDPIEIYPAKLLHCPNEPGRQFCKAAAFNMGVMNASSNFILLHDADMVVQINYAQLIYDKLLISEACHMGKDVAYFNPTATEQIYQSRVLPKDAGCERTVSYFEGGSLGVHKDVYERVGGFNEDFIGYGGEDCCFFRRLKSLSKFDDERTVTLFHLWHGRTVGWGDCHRVNKQKWAAFEMQPMTGRLAKLHRDLQKWKSQVVVPLKHVPVAAIQRMQEVAVGGVLCCGPDGGAFKFYTEGIGNAFRELGIVFEQWDGKDEAVIKKLQPRIYLACSEAWRHTYPAWARKEFGTKIIVHANPFGSVKVGSVDGGPTIDAKEHDIKWVLAQEPHLIICYAANDDVLKSYFNFWTERYGIKVLALPLAADHVTYGMGAELEQYKFDVGWIGGMWPYKQKMMDKYLVPLRDKHKCGFYGWNDAWGMGPISNEESKHLFRSCKICPSISEPHSVEHPVDLPERVYKVPCAGGFTIHTPTKVIAAMGLSSVIPVADGVGDWFEKIQYYLTHEAERQQLADLQRKAILGAHTYLHRIRPLIQEIYPEFDEVLDGKIKLVATL